MLIKIKGNLNVSGCTRLGLTLVKNTEMQLYRKLSPVQNIDHNAAAV